MHFADIDQAIGEGQLWVVVGGKGHGGITVRRGQSLQSGQMPFRLEQGSVVEELARRGDRLHYRRITGGGPDFGWVSFTFKGSRLLKKTTLEEDPMQFTVQKNKKRNRVTLPAEARDDSWTPLEQAVFLSSFGDCHPRRLAAQWRRDTGTSERVSVLTPTTETRHEFHEQLWLCFVEQAWPDKELIVVETYNDAPSPFFAAKVAAGEPRLVHICLEGDLSIGAKRNIGLMAASGKYVAHFDDDDLYAAEYIGTMVDALQKRNLAAVTFSAWYDCKVHGSIGFVDPEHFQQAGGHGSVWEDVLEAKQSYVKETTYGYGFSYTYLREATIEHPFPDVSMGEDYEFIMALCQDLGEDKVGLMPDAYGICLHLQHGRNTAPMRSDRLVPYEEAKDLAVSRLPLLDPRVQRLLQGLTRPQALQTLESLTKRAQDPAAVKRLQLCSTTGKGHKAEYRRLLTSLENEEEVFLKIACHKDMTREPFKIFHQMLEKSFWDDLELIEAWCELAVTLRDWKRASQLNQRIRELQQQPNCSQL